MRHFICTVQNNGKLHANPENPYVFGDLKIFFRGFIANIQEFYPPNKENKLKPESFYHAQGLAEAYKTYGSNLSQYVDGEYAVAIYDSANRTLLLAHDSLGLVPLYYYQHPDGITFASHINGIVSSNSRFQLDKEFIADYLYYGDHYEERTPYADIKRLTPGVSILYTNQRLIKNQCWGIFDTKPLRYSDKRDYEEHFRTLLKEGVETSLPRQGTTWCELSGGLDSSAVICNAARSSRVQNLRAISHVYPQSRTADESKWINAVTEMYNIDAYALNADAVRPFTELPLDFCGQPYHAMINAALYRVYGQVLNENNVDVILTGMGGDAVLMGDGPQPYFLADLLRKGRLLTLGQQITQWAAQTKQRRPLTYWFAQCAVAPAIRQFRNQVIQDHPPKIPWLATDYAAGLKRSQGLRKSWVPWDTTVADSWFMERIIRCSHIVSLWDYTSSMRTEFRHPLMYVPLIKFMYSIPWDVKLSPSIDRVLQRAALSNILPPLIAQRDTKAGPDQAFYTGLGSGADWGKLLTKRPLIAERGYVDRERWIHAVESAKLGRCISLKHFVATASLEFWLRQFETPLMDADTVTKKIITR